MSIIKTERREESRVVASSIAGLTATQPPAHTEAVPLGFQRHTVNVSMLENGAAAVRAAAAQPRPSGSVLLEIQGISFSQVPNFTFAVYVNLPEDETDARQKRLHYVGSVNFFGRDHVKGHPHGDEGTKTFTQVFDASALASRLRRAGRWNDDELRVTLEPVTPVAPRGKEQQRIRLSQQSAERAKLSYQRIALLVR